MMRCRANAAALEFYKVFYRWNCFAATSYAVHTGKTSLLSSRISAFHRHRRTCCYGTLSRRAFSSEGRRPETSLDDAERPRREQLSHSAERVRDASGRQNGQQDALRPHLRSLDPERHFREYMRSMPASIVVIAAPKSPDPRNKSYFGMAVSSFNTVAMSPTPVVSFNVKRPSHTLDRILETGYCRIHLLDSSPEAARIADVFTRGQQKSSSPFDTLGHAGAEIHDWGLPTIVHPAVFAHFVCKVAGTLPVHDHLIVTAEVESLTSDIEPDSIRGLAYQNRAYRGVGERLVFEPLYYPVRDVHIAPDCQSHSADQVLKSNASAEAGARPQLSLNGFAPTRPLRAPEHDPVDALSGHVEEKRPRRPKKVYDGDPLRDPRPFTLQREIVERRIQAKLNRPAFPSWRRSSFAMAQEAVAASQAPPPIRRVLTDKHASESPFPSTAGIYGTDAERLSPTNPERQQEQQDTESGWREEWKSQHEEGYMDMERPGKSKWELFNNLRKRPKGEAARGPRIRPHISISPPEFQWEAYPNTPAIAGLLRRNEEIKKTDDGTIRVISAQREEILKRRKSHKSWRAYLAKGKELRAAREKREMEGEKREMEGEKREIEGEKREMERKTVKQVRHDFEMGRRKRWQEQRAKSAGQDEKDEVETGSEQQEFTLYDVFSKGFF